ncbi:MAG: hypothetical protein J6V23_06925 [Bacteroidaceae bacterium]|nr:hypothetical protein [Bacteroidaceae bacterium]
MKLLWFLQDNCKIDGLSLYKNGSFSDMDIEYEGKIYKISLMEIDEEEK